MRHDVFICYASQDLVVAATLRDRLESDGVSCWMAPGSVRAGQIYSKAIVQAIEASRLMLFVLSKHADISLHVHNEIEQATSKRTPILPIKIDKTEPSNLDYYIRTRQWFDATRAPIGNYLDDLADDVAALIAGGPVLLNLSDAAAPTVTLESLEVNSKPAKARDEELRQQLARIATVNRGRPACFILLVDTSFSMNFPIASTDIRKKDAVADTVNHFLLSAINVSTKSDGVRDYFDVAILRYGDVGGGVDSIFGDNLVPITKVAESPIEWTTYHWKEDDGTEMEDHVPIWLKPLAKGKTVMKAAFEKALDLVTLWTSAHPDSFPPIVLNITDGGFTGGDPTPVVRSLQEQCTDVGGALVFTCHLSETEGKKLMFPTDEQAADFEKRMRQLYDMTSQMPDPMLREAKALGHKVGAGARGYVLNADAAALIQFLDIGTKGVEKLVEGSN